MAERERARARWPYALDWSQSWSGGHRKVIVFRPLYAVGGQDLGYLPGTENEKMSPWGQAVFDTLNAVTTSEVVDEITDRGMLEVLPRHTSAVGHCTMRSSSSTKPNPWRETSC